MEDRTRFIRLWFLVVLGLVVPPAPCVHAQLFENLEAFGDRLDAGDPDISSQWQRGNEGPKGIATGDLDGNGSMDLAASNLDGTVTVYMNDGTGSFPERRHLHTGLTTLRDILIADFTADGRADIVTVAVIEGQVVLFENLGGGDFGPARRTKAGQSARNLEAGDFDGDGALELAIAGPGIGVKQLRWTSDGTFREVTSLPELATDCVDCTKPVYSLKAYREPGSTKDWLGVTHAGSAAFWLLAGGRTGALEVKEGIRVTEGAYSVDIGPLTSAAATGAADLITAHRNLGFVEIRKASDGPARFAEEAHQRISIPGAPRAVRILDLDGDGWNDVAVVLRLKDRVLTYRNNHGVLVAATEMPVGRSPRDLAVGFFDLDGQLDLAVINRHSEDVSVLFGHPGQAGFGALDAVYLVDGEVAGLKVLDWNDDGRDDVVQLHRASGDVSVRLAQPGGKLAPPTLVDPMGEIPSAIEVVDVNNDGLQDTVVANLGVRAGSISVRLGQADGALGPERRYELPAGVDGRLFAIAAADFDGDGSPDLAAGYADCRVGFFKGMGDGTFESTGGPQFYVYEGKVMVAGDFDQDGDIDLAAAGYAGHLAVIENRGDLLTTSQIVREVYDPPSSGKFGTNEIKAVHANGDDDLDLILGSGDGVMIYVAVEGMGFVLDRVVEEIGFPVSSVGVADFDGDSRRDLAVACHILSCVTVLTKVDDGPEYVPALTIDVPAGRHLAIGDLDGDGHADLVGSGDVLWVALSSRRSERSGPPVLEVARAVTQDAVINEVLAINDKWPLETDSGKKADWVEIYNGGAEALPLSGWSLRLEKADAEEGEVSKVFAFPPEATLGHDEHLLVVFSKKQRSSYHTGFRLPGDGGTLSLIDQTGAIRDVLIYPRQRENLSYSRYSDGSRSFVFNNFPSPGSPNSDNGAVPPIFELTGLGSAAGSPGSFPQPGQPIRFLGRGEDDAVIVSVSVLYQRLDVPDSRIERVILFDDGMHGDGQLQDGVFAGDLEPGLPAGGEIRYQIEVEDISDNVTTLPNEDGVDFFTLAVGAELPTVELSEVVASNQSGLADESGRRADWVEIRNCSSELISLEGLFLAKNYPRTDDWFEFRPDRTLEPGAQVVIFCDADPEEGPYHAPFNLDADADRIFLIGSTPRGGHALLDSLEFGPQQPDMALVRQGCGGPWEFGTPTPGGRGEGEGIETGDVNANGRRDIADAILLLHFLFAGRELSCPAVADVNGDTSVDLSDVVYLLGYLFAAGPRPVPSMTSCAR